MNQTLIARNNARLRLSVRYFGKDLTTENTENTENHRVFSLLCEQKSGVENPYNRG